MRSAITFIIKSLKLKSEVWDLSFFPSIKKKNYVDS